MDKTLPINKPNRRTVEMLFSDLLRGDRDDCRYRQYSKLCEELDDLKDKLLSCKKYMALERRRKAAYRKWDDVSTKRHEAVLSVKRMYLARGLTPAVQKAIDKLLEDIKKIEQP